MGSREHELDAADVDAVAWSKPCRRSTDAVTPLYGAGEIQLLVAKGAWNNADVYVSGAAATWVAPPGGGTLTLRLYALVAGASHLVMATVGPIANFAAAFYDLWVLASRGRVTDGWRVTLEATGGVGAFGSGRVTMFCWGHETAFGGVSGTSPLPAVDVSIVPADAWGPGLTGTIGAGPPATGSSITAGVSTPAQSYVDVSASLANTGILYVASASVANTAAEYELLAGDTVRIEIDDAALIFVNGSVVGDKWRAAKV